jgi:hypothetical protein
MLHPLLPRAGVSQVGMAHMLGVLHGAHPGVGDALVEAALHRMAARAAAAAAADAADAAASHSPPPTPCSTAPAPSQAGSAGVGAGGAAAVLAARPTAVAVAARDAWELLAAASRM